ncbi:MAG: iron-containing alcohol dehydrogenase [Candidatus Hermodarchaeota archaeon]
MIPSFTFARIPHIIFGAGKLGELYEIIPKFGKNILFITGKSSLKNSGKWDEISAALDYKSLNYLQFSISSEPSPTLIDDAATEFRKKNIELIVSIGGGSVIDAGKAISAMIPKENSIKNYLEGVGTKIHDGKKLPFIAIPTTSGTGSEATKNAVISEIGPNGFKKSLRHENFIPEVALIDPQFMVPCPPAISAACGMDAFTQLIEAYVSPQGNPMTDALAVSGMKFIIQNLIPACSSGASRIEVRASLAYASLISGIALANAGLGIVHGLASAIGGLFDIPHGVICGTLLAEATRMNIKKLLEQGSNGVAGLRKYADIGMLFSDKKKKNIVENCSILVKTLDKWTNDLKLARLNKYSIKVEDLKLIVDKTGIKNNPVRLKKDEIRTIITNRL